MTVSVANKTMAGLPAEGDADIDSWPSVAADYTSARLSKAEREYIEGIAGVWMSVSRAATGHCPDHCHRPF
jgi:hypothetical protein